MAVFSANKPLLALFLLAGSLASTSCRKDQVTSAPVVKVLTATQGFRHDAIANGLNWFEKEAPVLNYRYAHWPLSDSLAQLSYPEVTVLVLLHTTGDFLNAGQEKKLQDFVQAGGRVMAIHAAADAEYDWAWYGKLIGARFDSHPPVQKARLYLEQHALASSLPPLWEREDEWYNFKEVQSGSAVLLKLDEQSYTGGNMGNNHPVAWTRDVEGGRVFYTALGHTPASYDEVHFRTHLSKGLEYLLQP